MPELSLPTDPIPTNDSYGPTAWRASALPDWKSEIPGEIPEWPDKANNEESPAPPAALGAVGGAPYRYHRWLPLRDNDSHIYSTPIAQTEWKEGSKNQLRWALGAQTHYSLLENLEKGELQRYVMTGGDGTFNMRLFHANVNLMAIWGKDVQENMPYGEGGWDEMVITVDIPRSLHRGTHTHSFPSLSLHSSFHFPFWRIQSSRPDANRQPIRRDSHPDTLARRTFCLRRTTGDVRHRSTQPLPRIRQRNDLPAR